MPYKKKYLKRRAPRRRRAPMRRPMRRSPLPLAPTGSFASRRETYSIPATAGQVYDLNDIRINAQFVVAPILANLYQYYRITSVEMRIKPNYDAYVAGGTSGTGALPYLYFLYDKSGSLGNLNATQFEECGAKPVRVDEKTILRKWKPSVRIGDLNQAVPMFKTSPWMPTHSTDGITVNAPNHMGAVWYISKVNPSDAQIYDIDVTVTFQFKKPLVTPVQ